MNNMESFNQGGDARKEVSNFLDAHSEYKDNNFSQEEIGFVTQRVAEEIALKTKNAEEMQSFIGRAFDARLAVRGGAETAVIDNGEVVGVAGSPDEAKGMMFGARNEK